ncbi:predicted protein [Postia placenta Mad-698-R]|nr:predicted protein [Postia placenta Mad-698-R]
MLELIVSGKIGGTQYRDYSLLDFHRDIDDVFGTSGMNRRGRYGGLGLLEDSGVTRRLVAHIRRTARPAKPENVQVVDVFMSFWGTYIKERSSKSAGLQWVATMKDEVTNRLTIISNSTMINSLRPTREVAARPLTDTRNAHAGVTYNAEIRFHVGALGITKSIPLAAPYSSAEVYGVDETHSCQSAKAAPAVTAWLSMDRYMCNRARGLTAPLDKAFRGKSYPTVQDGEWYHLAL